MAEIENLKIGNGTIHIVGNQDIVADSWEAGKTYVADRSYVIREHILYVCNTTHTSVEPFDPTKWTATTVNDQIDNVATAIPTTDNNLPHYTGTPTAGTTAEAITALQDATTTDGLHNITLGSGFSVAEYMNYIKLGKLVIVNIGGLIHTGTGGNVLVCQGLPTMVSRGLSVVANDTTSGKTCLIYGAINTTRLYISAHDANTKYYGQIVYITNE